jgi:hypothetical protein
VAEQLKLTDEQKKQVAELEKDTKAKLGKILTSEQKKILEKARPPRPGQGGPGDQGGRRPRRGRGPNGPEAGPGGPEGGPDGPADDSSSGKPPRRPRPDSE